MGAGAAGGAIIGATVGGPPGAIVGAGIAGGVAGGGAMNIFSNPSGQTKAANRYKNDKSEGGGINETFGMLKGKPLELDAAQRAQRKAMLVRKRLI